MPQLSKWVEVESIPEFLGGRSHGTLIDDVGPWSDPEVLDKVRAQHEGAHMWLVGWLVGWLGGM